MSRALRPVSCVAVILAGCLAPWHTPGLPPVGPIRCDGFARPIPGRWIAAPSAVGGVPVGGIGTGYLEVFPGGAIQLVPSPGATPVSGIRLSLAQPGRGKPTSLLGPVDEATLRPPSRFFGHYPIADLEYAPDAVPGLTISVRVLGTILARKAQQSNTPAALVRVTIVNRQGRPATVQLRLVAPGTGSPGHEPFTAGAVRGLQYACPRLSETLAVAGPGAGVRGDGLETTLRIPAGTTGRTLYAIAWHLPTQPDRAERPIMNRYAARFADARGVAESLLRAAPQTEMGVARWQEAIYSARYPAWMRDMLVNSLADLTRTTCWPVGGPLYSASTAGAADHAPGWSTADLALLLLYPDLDRDCLYSLADHRTPAGAVPSSATPEGLSAVADGDPLAACAFVARCRRHGIATLDDAYFRRIYPSARSAMQFVMSTDRNSDGLVDLPTRPSDDPDTPPSRSGSVYAIAGIGALRCAEEMAIDAGDGTFARYCHEQRTRALASLEEKLWTGKHYRASIDFDTGDLDDGCPADQLLGYLWARLGGVDPQIPTDRVTASAGAVLEGSLRWHSPGAATDRRQPQNDNPALAWEWSAAALYSATAVTDSERAKQALMAAQRAWDRTCGEGRQWGPASAATPSWAAAAWCVPYGLAKLSTAAPDTHPARPAGRARAPRPR